MKKNLILSIAFIIVATLSHAQIHYVTLDEAFAATNIDETSGIETYFGITSDIITPATPVSNTYLANVLASTVDKWVIYVDEEPGKNWSHNCSYYYIPKTVPVNSAIPAYRQTARMPIYDYTLYPHTTNSFHHHQMPSLVPTPLDVASTNAISHTYAVILSGGWDKSINYSRYWNDCSFIYQVLKKRFGIPQGNIRVIMADGTDSGADMRVGNNQYVSSPTDLDGDGIVDITCSATKQNLTTQLQSLASIMTSQDRLFFFVIDHGGLDSFGASIFLWNHGRIYDYELAELLDDFNVGSMNIVMGQCNSGGFIDNLAAPNRVISTACSAAEESNATNNFVYDEFVYQWTTAINERDDFNNWTVSDTDDNGYVSMREAFVYARDHDIEKHLETPQFSPSNGTLGDTWAFNLTPFAYDLVIKDNYEDTGEEPNTTTTVGWDSPHVWMRQTADGIGTHQNVSIQNELQQLYTYVKIVNNGEKPYYGAGRYLKLYWADASLGITRDVWLGNISSNGLLKGGPSRESLLITDVIEPGDSVVKLVNWPVPQDIWYAVNVLGQDFHICHLAVIMDTYDANANNLPVQNGGSVVHPLYHRNIGQKNVFFVNPTEGTAPEIRLNVRNVAEERGSYSIELLPAGEEEASASNIEVTARLSESLYEAWRNGGSMAEKTTAYKSAPSRLYLRGGNSMLDNISLDVKQSGTIHCSCSVIANEDITEEKTYKYDLVQRDRNSGTIVGGERFEIHVKPRPAILPVIEQMKVDDKLVLIAANIHEDVKYEWFDEDGNMVGEGKEVAVGVANTRTQYLLKVTAKSDGAINYATAIVGEAFGIAGISPVPFVNQLHIKLSAPADEATAIRLTPVSSPAVVTEDYQVKSGESEIAIRTDGLVQGNYLVSLIHDGTVVSTRQITRK